MREAHALMACDSCGAKKKKLSLQDLLPALSLSALPLLWVYWDLRGLSLHIEDFCGAATSSGSKEALLPLPLLQNCLLWLSAQQHCRTVGRNRDASG